MGTLLHLVFLLCYLLICLTIHGRTIPHTQCSYQPPTKNQVLPPVLLEPHHVLRKRSISNDWKPIRISVFYDNSSLSALSVKRQGLIKNVILPRAIKFWNDTLTLVQNREPIRLHRKCVSNEAGEYKVHYPFPNNTNIFYCDKGCDPKTFCGDVQVPDEHLLQCLYLATEEEDVMSSFFGSPARQVKQASGPPDGDGVAETDFVLYVSTLETERCNISKTVAYAAHCQQEMTFDRPIAGHANLCPHAITDNPTDIESILSTVKHEILHALGFSVALFAFFRDAKTGEPLTKRDKYGRPPWNADINSFQWSDNTIRSVERPDWEVRGGSIARSVSMFVTPRVVEEAKRHFACPDVEGGELENQGGEGTAMTHWEKRVFENEAMTGVHTQNPIYSNLTLALLEDSGWYRPDYSVAGVVNFGAGLGCEFAMKSCKSWMDRARAAGTPVAPYCDKLKNAGNQKMIKTECSAEKNSLSICNLSPFVQDLPPQYQNFDRIDGVPDSQVSRYGGSVDLADFCPFMQEFSWKSAVGTVRGSRCVVENNQPDENTNFALETYGDHSMCFAQDKAWKERTCQFTRTWQHWGSGCYEYVCKDGRIEILIQNRSLVCLAEGQSLSLQVIAHDWLHTGTIVCPSCASVCQKTGDFQCLPDMPDHKNREERSVWDDLDCSAAGRLRSAASGRGIGIMPR